MTLQVLKHLWSSQYKSISASDLKSRVGRAKTEFAGRDQQDSHEFLLSLLEWLHDDTNKVRQEIVRATLQLRCPGGQT